MPSVPAFSMSNLLSVGFGVGGGLPTSVGVSTPTSKTTSRRKGLNEYRFSCCSDSPTASASARTRNRTRTRVGTAPQTCSFLLRCFEERQGGFAQSSSTSVCPWYVHTVRRRYLVAHFPYLSDTNLVLKNLFTGSRGKVHLKSWTKGGPTYEDFGVLDTVKIQQQGRGSIQPHNVHSTGWPTILYLIRSVLGEGTTPSVSQLLHPLRVGPVSAMKVVKGL
jgi:hypothetical protein